MARQVKPPINTYGLWNVGPLTQADPGDVLCLATTKAKDADWCIVVMEIKGQYWIQSTIDDNKRRITELQGAIQALWDRERDISE